MLKEAENEVVRYDANFNKIESGRRWSPTGSEEELLVIINEPTIVTSILVTDEVKRITFTVSYKPEDSNEFKDYVDEFGQPEVSVYYNHYAL